MADMQTTQPTFDVLARLAEPEVRRNPFPLLGWLRENEPVYKTSVGFYLLTRHEDVMWVLRNTGDALLGPSPKLLEEQYPEASQYRTQRLFLNSVAMKDPPEHGRLRGAVTNALSADLVNRLVPRIREICDGLLETLAGQVRDGETVDLHTQFSLPLSTTVFAELLGVPLTDADWLANLIAEIYTATMPMADENVATYAERFSRADERSARLTAYFLELFEQRRQTPHDDLVSALVSRRTSGVHQLSDDELLSMVWILWVAGVETAAGGIDHGLRAMLVHRDQTHWIHGTDSDVQAFGEESLRLYGSSLYAGIVRIASRDLRFGDVVIPAGSDVRPSTASANRDPGVFADPDAFDPSRSHQLSVSWGYGMRHCFGAHLARAEMNVALLMMHSRFPDLALAGEPTWHDGVSTRLMRGLPAAVGAA
jgi:cytochrome P450